MATGDLTTTAAVRAFLRGSVPVPLEDDPVIEALITSVSQAFQGATDCPVTSAEVVEVIDGNGRSRVFLENYPVESVASVLVDDVEIPARPSSTEAGWVLGNATIGRLDLSGYTFGEGIGNVQITYTAGYGSEVPADVAQACVDQVAYLYRQRDRIGISNQSVGGESVTYLGSWSGQQGKDGLTPQFAAVVARYRRVS